MPSPRSHCPLYQRIRGSIVRLVPRSRKRKRREFQIGSELCWLAVRISFFPQANLTFSSARRQLAFDMWWLALSLWLICIIEVSVNAHVKRKARLIR